MATTNYYSKWTGQQVDDAVENAANAVTLDDIVQVQGNSPSKIMSQGAVTSALNNLPSAQDITNAINEHNSSSSAHSYIRGLISAKPDIVNTRSSSQTDTYSANYVNNNFAPLTFVSNLYATKQTSSSASLDNTKPTLDAGNTLTSTTSNTAFDWTTPNFTLIRTLENAITINNENSFTADIYFSLDRDIGMSWGALISASTDDGATWEQVSTQQSFGEMAYTTGTLTYESLQIFTDALTGAQEYPIGTLLKIDLFTKFDGSHTTTNTIYCGVTIDNASVYSYVQFNFTNITIDTNQINDGAVTLSKLSTSLQNSINSIEDKQEKVDLETITLATANWLTSGSNVYSYNYTLDTITYTPSFVRVSAWQSDSSADLQLVKNNNDYIADAEIYNISQVGNTLTFYASSLPSNDIKLQLEVFE